MNTDINLWEGFEELPTMDEISYMYESMY